MDFLKDNQSLNTENIVLNSEDTNNTEKWHQLTINTNPEIADSISDYLFEEGLEGIFLNKENIDSSNNKVQIVAFFTEEFININLLTNHLISKFNLKETDILVNQVENTDWVNDSQQHFQTFSIGENIIIKPIWQEYEAKQNQTVINFDPGSFFGATPHPSTKLCLEEIEKIAKSLDKNSRILDLGVGSGILSLLLNSLGFKNITAIDIDPVAIRSAKDNFVLNQMNTELFLGEIKDCDGTFDFIAGNLLAQTIEELAIQISEKLNKEGIFIGAGINIHQEKSVIETLKAANLFTESTIYSDEWVLIRAIKK